MTTIPPTTPWFSICVGVVAAFASTFAGVYAASRLAESEKRSEETAAFNALFREMSRNCDNALEVINSSGITDEPVPIVAPTLLFTSIHTEAVTLNNVDEDRMTELIRAVGEVDAAAQKYSHAANKHDRRFSMEFPAPFPPPDNAHPHIKEGFQNALKQWKDIGTQKSLSIQEIKSLHDAYKNKIGSTCNIFKELVQSK